MSAFDAASWWPAPAKLNLFLHVVGRRADGYHLLQTVFRFIDCTDRLRFTPTEDGRIERETDIAGVPAEADLSVRAAHALQQASGTRAGAIIAIDKRLPMGGGLGGGSSDAATTLIALNHLWGTGASRQDLQRIGIGLGADVPVFIHGRTTFAEGVGERFTDVVAPPAWYLVLVPPVSVPTAVIFGDPALRRDTPPIGAADWRPDFGGNDLEAVATRRFPAVADHLAWLRGLAPARMSGSGACCFAAFADAAAAQAALARLPAGWRGFAARGLDEHPLLSI